MSRDLFKRAADELEAAGFAKGYRQAVRDMRRELGASLDNMLKTDDGPAEEVKPSRTYSPVTEPTITQARPSAQLQVLNIIHAIPGLTGAGIVAQLKLNGMDVEERTVRTALFRLKKRGFIEQRGEEKEWYRVNAPRFGEINLE